MSETTTKRLRDSSHLKIVSVIASFDTSGNITPLYVRIGEDSLKIYNSVCSSASTYRLLSFDCEVMDGDLVKPLRLTYHSEEQVWTILTTLA